MQSLSSLIDLNDLDAKHKCLPFDRLTFAELEFLTSFWLTWFLTFDHTWVTTH